MPAPAAPAGPAAPAAPAAPTARADQVAAVEPLGPRFVGLLGFTGLSNLADGILMVGVPLLALTLTRSPAQISLLSAAFTLPWLLFAVHAGLLVDRYDRVRLLVAATSVRVAVLALGAAAAATGRLTMPLLLGLLLAFGTSEVLADSSATALVPRVVPRSRLSAGNSRLLGVQQLANAFVGGPLAGVVLGLGAGWLFGVPAALCAAGTVLVLRRLSGRVGTPVVTRGEVPMSGGATPRRPVRSELHEGWTFLRGHRVVWPLLVTGTVLNFASAAYFAVFVLWVVGPSSAVGLRPELYGVLLTALAAGALTGAVATERLQRYVGEARLITGSWLLNTLLLLVPVLAPRPGAIAAAFVALGLTNMVGNVVNQSMRQRLVPDRLLGRVGGVSRTLSYGSMPLGAALGGVVGEAFGLPAVLLGAVAVSLASVLWITWAVPQRRIDDADATNAAEDVGRSSLGRRGQAIGQDEACDSSSSGTDRPRPTSAPCSTPPSPERS